MSRQQRRYTPEDIAVALAALEANGGNLSQTARDTGVPRKTLASWVESTGPTMPDGETRQEKKEDLIDVFKRVAHKAAMLQGVALEWIETQSGDVVAKFLPDLNRVAGTATDKAQLLDGKPTQRVETRDAPEVERRAARILTLMAPVGTAVGKRKRA